MKLRFTALILCGACILMFVLQVLIGTEFFLLIRSQMLSEPWRLVTSLFAHGGMDHLLANLFALGLFGLLLEGRIGGNKLLMLFFTSGIVVNLITPYERSLGASGAIMAIIGALTVLRPKMTVWVSGMPMPMIIAGLIYLIQDSLGLFIPSDVGHWAHLGGLFIGVGFGFYWRKEFGDRLFKKKNPRDKEIDRELDKWEEKYMK
ncbi:rhomboid family intramembrane serine protease [Nanoarchaeota archaeon]